MSDELSKIILVDTAVSSVERSSSPRRRFFGRGRKQRPPLSHCENCGALLAGRYCGQCGQPAIDYRRSFGHVLVDVLNEFLNWDSKFLATIGLLIAKPWRLTNEFLGGHRVRYVHPLRIYLLASILFFFAVNYWAKSIHLDPVKMTPETRAEVEAALDKENLTPEQRAKVDRVLKMTSMSPERAAKMAAKVKRKDATADQSATPAESVTPEPEVDEPKTGQETESDRPLLQFGHDNPSNSFEKWLQDRGKEKIGEYGTNAELFLRTLISNLPYMVLCCIPLFAFVLKILYIRRKIFYIDHLIYALHIHAFAYLAIMLIVLATIGLERSVPGALAGWIIGLLWTTFAVQIFLSIRRVYRQGWFFTVFKFFLGGWVYLIVLCFALAATLFITLALP